MMGLKTPFLETALLELIQVLFELLGVVVNDVVERRVVLE